MTPSPRAAPTSAPSQDSACAISVVVGSINSARTVGRVLEALQATTAGLDAEIVLVDASTDGTAARAREAVPGVIVRELPAGTLTPRLWSAGLAMSRGRVVAFTTGHCVVERGWARALIDGIAGGATGVAGSLTLARDSGPVDWALYYLRYSAFLGLGERIPQDAHEIPGDNAAYARDALDRHAASFENGFWEVDFHRRL